MSKFFTALLITLERVYSLHRKNGIVCAEVSKNLVRYIDLKIILLDHLNNYLHGRPS